MCFLLGLDNVLLVHDLESVELAALLVLGEHDATKRAVAERLAHLVVGELDAGAATAVAAIARQPLGQKAALLLAQDLDPAPLVLLVLGLAAAVGAHHVRVLLLVVVELVALEEVHVATRVVDVVARATYASAAA